MFPFRLFTVIICATSALAGLVVRGSIVDANAAASQGQSSWDGWKAREEWRNNPREWPPVVHFDLAHREQVQNAWRMKMEREAEERYLQRVAADLKRLQGTHLALSEAIEGDRRLIAEVASERFRQENPEPDARTKLLSFREAIIAGWEGVINDVRAADDDESYTLKLTVKPRLTGPAIYFLMGELKETWKMHADGRLQFLDSKLVGGILFAD